jgi:hypothetical protein
MNLEHLQPVLYLILYLIIWIYEIKTCSNRFFIIFYIIITISIFSTSKKTMKDPLFKIEDRKMIDIY